MLFRLLVCRLTAHLGITIPDECGIRVGGVDMTWEEGKVSWTTNFATRLNIYDE